MWQTAPYRPKLLAMRYVALLLLLTAFALWQAVSQANDKPYQPIGSMDGENTYTNPVLGIRVTLPGKWRLMVPTKYAQNAPSTQPSDPQCRGPLCGQPQVDEALETAPVPVQTLFLNGYKLEPEYLNRERYPLKKFADVMMQGSLAGSDWVPVGGMSELQLAGRRAYRLLVHDPSKPGKKGFGIVFESNGYVCLLVGTDVTQSQSLLAAVEHMTASQSTTR